MKSKSHGEFLARIQNALWMVLVLLCIGLIWRGLGDWLAIIESGYAPGTHVEFANLLPAITRYLLDNFQSEFFPFVGQVFGLACLLHIGPLKSEPMKQSPVSNLHPSVTTGHEIAESREVIS